MQQKPPICYDFLYVFHWLLLLKSWFKKYKTYLYQCTISYNKKFYSKGFFHEKSLRDKMSLYLRDSVLSNTTPHLQPNSDSPECQWRRNNFYFGGANSHKKISRNCWRRGGIFWIYSPPSHHPRSAAYAGFWFGLKRSFTFVIYPDLITS